MSRLSLEGINYWWETTEMDRDLLKVAGALASIFASFVSIIIALSGKQWREAQDRARERRMAEHRMNARLLRLNI
jgi:hypothetical protein